MSTQKDFEISQSKVSELQNKLREAETLRQKIHKQRQDLEIKLDTSGLNVDYLQSLAKIVSLKEFLDIRKHQKVQRFQLNEITKELQKLDLLIEKQKELIEQAKLEMESKKMALENKVIPFRSIRGKNKT